MSFEGWAASSPSPALLVSLVSGVLSGVLSRMVDAAELHAEDAGAASDVWFAAVRDAQEVSSVLGSMRLLGPAPAGAVLVPSPEARALAGVIAFEGPVDVLWGAALLELEDLVRVSAAVVEGGVAWGVPEERSGFFDRVYRSFLMLELLGLLLAG